MYLTLYDGEFTALDYLGSQPEIENKSVTGDLCFMSFAPLRCNAM